MFDFLKIKRENIAVPATTPPRLRLGAFGIAGEVRKYSDAYVWLVFNKVCQGLANARFYNREGREDFARLCGFVETNIQALWLDTVTNGFAVVAFNGEDYYIPQGEAVRLDPVTRQVAQPKGEVWVAIYSRTFALVGRSALQILRDNIENIDDYKNADNYLCRTYGAIGILSGRDIPLNLNDRSDINEAIKQASGIGRDKSQFILSNTPLDYKQVVLPIAALKLTEKVDAELKLIADYFGVPYDLLAISGQSTYANQEQAVKTFYSGCVAPFCEDVLQAVKTFVRQSSIMIDSNEFTFSFDNVDGLKDERDTRIERLANLGRLYGEMQDVPAVAEKLAAEIQRIAEDL